MSGLPDYNRESFHDAEARLRSKGFDVVNPANNGVQGEWMDFILFDLTQLRTCDAIYFLEGWQNSYGARIEQLVAEKLGLKVIYF